MKKIGTIFGAALLACALVACGGSKKTAAKPGDKGTMGAPTGGGDGSAPGGTGGASYGGDTGGGQPEPDGAKANPCGGY